jgi:enamine deaminase RidA (YjgF/YER057c/UK114 family)
MSYENKLKEMGFTIEPAPLSFGKFVQAIRTRDLVFTSGQVPIWGDTTIKGVVGADLTIQEGYDAARLCTLNNLRAIKAVIGSLDNIVTFVRVLGMVNVSPGFTETPAVINGCSDFLVEVFGPAGAHTRSAVGMTLPLNFAVEIEMVVQVR